MVSKALHMWDPATTSPDEGFPKWGPYLALFTDTFEKKSCRSRVASCQSLFHVLAPLNIEGLHFYRDPQKISVATCHMRKPINQKHQSSERLIKQAAKPKL